MPLDDAMRLVGQNFEQYMQDLRERAKASSTQGSSKDVGATVVKEEKTTEISALLNKAATGVNLSADQLTKLIDDLSKRQQEILGSSSTANGKGGKNSTRDFFSLPSTSFCHHGLGNFFRSSLFSYTAFFSWRNTRFPLCSTDSLQNNFPRNATNIQIVPRSLSHSEQGFVGTLSSNQKRISISLLHFKRTKKATKTFIKHCFVVKKAREILLVLPTLDLDFAVFIRKYTLICWLALKKRKESFCKRINKHAVHLKTHDIHS